MEGGKGEKYSDNDMKEGKILMKKALNICIQCCIYYIHFKL